MKFNLQAIFQERNSIRLIGQNNNYPVLEFWLDCSNRNELTGEILFQNILPLKLSGQKQIDKLGTTIENLQRGDWVEVEFWLQGGKEKYSGLWKYLNVKIRDIVKIERPYPVEESN